MKKLFLLLIISLSFTNLIYASFPITEQIVIDSCDNIILKNGDEISVKIIEITPDLIKYKKCNYLNGPLISIYKDEILMVRYSDGSKDLFTSSSSYMMDAGGRQPASILSFICAGFGFFIALGLPLGIAAVILGIIGVQGELKWPAILGIIWGAINIILVLSVM